jgi:hypothetical protein
VVVAGGEDSLALIGCQSDRFVLPLIFNQF